MCKTIWMVRGLALLVFWTSSSLVLRAQGPLEIQVADSNLARRSLVDVTVTNGFSDADRDLKKLSVRLQPAMDATVSTETTKIEGTRGTDPTHISFSVPRHLSLGLYRLGLVRSQSEPDPARTISVKITSDIALRPVLRSVSPSVSFLEDEHVLTLVGDFSEVPGDHILVLQDVNGVHELSAKWDGKAPDNAKDEIRGNYYSPHRIVFSEIPEKYEGAQQVQLRIGDVLTDPAINVILSPVGRRTPLVATVVVTIILLGIATAIAMNGLRRPIIADVKQGLLATLLLDAETETLSLSKFQFYLWTIVSIFGYMYLLLVMSLVRAQFVFPEIPTNLPAVLLLSGGTWVLSLGATAARGPKGSGTIQPSLSDFITVGGMVSVERFQFFVWTLLGALAFVFLIVSQGTAQFQSLPSIPDGFLYLMGSSSVGYVAGKFVRKAGPVIDSVTGRVGSVIVSIKGRRLSRQASISIEGRDVTFDEIGAQAAPPKELPTGSTKDAVLEVIAKDTDANDPTLCSELRLTLFDVSAWEKRSGLPPGTLKKFWPSNSDSEQSALSDMDKMRVSITNPDGQMSEWFCEFKRQA